MEGWIKLHRQLLDSSIFKNERLLKLWIWILMKASHEERTTRIGLHEIELKQGQFVFGLHCASQELDMPQTTVYRMMEILEKENRITKKVENKKTLVTVENWGFFQCVQTKMENQWKDNGKSMETNKNLKNGNNLINNKNNARACACTREGTIPYHNLVWMTEEEHDRLVRIYGEDDTYRMIEMLNSYKLAHGTEYDNDYGAILSWCVKQLELDKRNGVYDAEDFADEVEKRLLEERRRNLKC